MKTCFLNLLETRIEFLSARGILLHVKNCSCATRVRTGGGVDSGRGWTLGSAVGALHRFVLVAGLKLDSSSNEIYAI